MRLLNRKKFHMFFVKALTWGTAGMFLFTFLLPLDPPDNEGKSPPYTKMIFLVSAMFLCGWIALFGLPKLSRSTTQMKLLANALSCVSASFSCAMCGLFIFLEDSPHLGSPWLVLPYFAVATYINVFCILPRMARYQPTKADLAPVKIIR